MAKIPDTLIVIGHADGNQHCIYLGNDYAERGTAISLGVAQYERVTFGRVSGDNLEEMKGTADGAQRLVEAIYEMDAKEAPQRRKRRARA